jgi:hypothetical protein
VINRERGGKQIKNRSPFGQTGTVPTVVVKVAFGVVLALIVLQAWHQITELDKRQEAIDNWTNTRDYAVFFPHLNGDDLAELTSGGHATKIAEARDLYPVLDENGAIFIDASNYGPRIPRNWTLPPPIRVNSNYLDRFPILDDSGTPIDVDRDEQAWVVAVPEKFRAQEAEIKAHFQGTRIGDQGLDGAVQGQERMLGEAVPVQFRNQEVRIIWMASGQEVFSFSSTVNPEAGNMIVDPIVEIMTPANSLTVDRLNSITGDINTPLKVLVDGDPASVLQDLSPTLEELKLDDNLKHLVTGNEAALRELSDLRRAIAWTAAAAGGFLVVMLAFSASLVTIICDRLRRTLTVRRLHGVGFIRTYKELLVLLGTTWLGQTLVAGVAIVLWGTASGPLPAAAASPFAEIPRLLAVLVLVSVIEALFAAVLASAIERRQAVRRLKEL